jgi:hypothetical protein
MFCWRCTRLKVQRGFDMRVIVRSLRRVSALLIFSESAPVTAQANARFGFPKDKV